MAPWNERLAGRTAADPPPPIGTLTLGGPSVTVRPTLDLTPRLDVRVSPALVASTELLALPVPDLEQLVERALAGNPALERVDRPACPGCGVRLAGHDAPNAVPGSRGAPARHPRKVPIPGRQPRTGRAPPSCCWPRWPRYWPPATAGWPPTSSRTSTTAASWTAGRRDCGQAGRRRRPGRAGDPGHPRGWPPRHLRR